MIPMKRVDDEHILYLDTGTDIAYVVKGDTGEAVLHFDSSCNIIDPTKPEYIGRFTIRGNNWVVETDLPITCEPVSLNKVEGVFEIEAEFAKQWIQLKKEQ